MLIDSHCHLHMLDLSKYEHGLETVIKNSRDNGVAKLLCVATDLEEYKDLIKIAADYPDYVYISAGIHPSEVQRYEIDKVVQELSVQAQHKSVIAIGEIGLDFYYDKDHHKQQKDLFLAQIEVAAKYKLPIIVHTRDAEEETAKLLRQAADLGVNGVLHCFTGTWDLAQKGLDLGFYVSISGIVTFKNAEDLRSVAKQVPLDRILVETDSPYLAPVPKRGKPNEPAWVRYVAEYVAELRQLDVDQFIDQTGENFNRLFKI